MKQRRLFPQREVDSLVGEMPGIISEGEIDSALGGTSVKYPLINRSWGKKVTHNHAIKIQLDEKRDLNINVTYTESTTDIDECPQFKSSALVGYRNNRRGGLYFLVDGRLNNSKDPNRESYNNRQAIRKLRKSKTAMKALRNEAEQSLSLKSALEELLK